MRKLGTGTIILMASLLGILALTIFWSVSVWNTSDGTSLGPHGWIALGLGTFFSLVIGGGLMALMFYSNRSGHDEAADPFRKREPPPSN